MTEALSQFGRRLREHLKEQRPKMYAALESSGGLDDYLMSQQRLYEFTLESTEESLRSQQSPPEDFLERVGYEERIRRIAREIAFAEAWPKSEEDQPTLGEDGQPDPIHADQDEPTPLRRPFYTGSMSSGRQPRQRSVRQECIYRLCGAVINFVLVFAITSVAMLGLGVLVELWNLAKLLSRFDWNLKLASLFIEEHWTGGSHFLEAAYFLVVFFGGFCGIASSIGVLATGDSIIPDLQKRYPKLTRLLRWLR